MNDRPLEDLAIETMDLLVHLLSTNPDPVERRKEIQVKLDKYCERGNCGITDDICDAAYELSEDEKNINQIGLVKLSDAKQLSELVAELGYNLSKNLAKRKLAKNIESRYQRCLCGLNCDV